MLLWVEKKQLSEQACLGIIAFIQVLVNFKPSG